MKTILPTLSQGTKGLGSCAPCPNKRPLSDPVMTCHEFFADMLLSASSATVAPVLEQNPPSSIPMHLHSSKI